MDAMVVSRVSSMECCFARHPLLAQLRQPAKAAVVAASRQVRHRASRSVLREGDPATVVYCLIEGAVRCFHRPANGREPLAMLCRAPALFGAMEALIGSPMLEHVSTLAPSEIVEIPSSLFLQVIETQPELTNVLIGELSTRLCIAMMNERASGLRKLETRLADLLLDYATLFGVPEPGGMRISVGITQASMARDLAISRRSLIRALDRLRTDGMITKQQARYLIRDFNALKARGSGMPAVTYCLDPLRVPADRPR